MIKVHVRAIMAHKEHYILMGDVDKHGVEVWDLPGGELKPGINVKEWLQRMVLEYTGYEIGSLSFFEVLCRVQPRKRGQDPLTMIDFVFTCRVIDAHAGEPTKQLELLPFARFEWLESDGRFRENNTMALLGRFHHRQQALHADQLKHTGEA